MSVNRRLTVPLGSSLTVELSRESGGSQSQVGGLESGEGRNRTGDPTVFSRVLYQLSYLAEERTV